MEGDDGKCTDKPDDKKAKTVAKVIKAKTSTKKDDRPCEALDQEECVNDDYSERCMPSEADPAVCEDRPPPPCEALDAEECAEAEDRCMEGDDGKCTDKPDDKKAKTVAKVSPEKAAKMAAMEQSLLG